MVATGIAFAYASYWYPCQAACFSPSGLALFTMCGCAEHSVAATISLFLYLKEIQNLSIYISATPKNSGNIYWSIQIYKYIVNVSSSALCLGQDDF